MVPITLFSPIFLGLKIGLLQHQKKSHIISFYFYTSDEIDLWCLVSVHIPCFQAIERKKKGRFSKFSFFNKILGKRGGESLYACLVGRNKRWEIEWIIYRESNRNRITIRLFDLREIKN